MATTNYYNTFIEVSADCPVKVAEIPPLTRGVKTVSFIQFEMIAGSPYKFTSDDIIFHVFALKNNITGSKLISEKEIFFSKGQPCLRASPLPKRYGWGIHSNAEGKVAIYAVESAEYKNYLKDKDTKHLKAMRSGRI